MLMSAQFIWWDLEHSSVRRVNDYGWKNGPEIQFT